MTLINFNVMVGLSQSGKTSFLRRIEAPYIFANLSDELEDIIFAMADGQLDNEPIFLDRNNITIEDRRIIWRWIQTFFPKDIHFHITAYVMSTPLDTCVKRGIENGITPGIIARQRASFNIPFLEEGFDDIKIVDGVSLEEIKTIECDSVRYSEMMYKMINFDQENPHHQYPLGVHMSVCQWMVEEQKDNFHDFSSVYVAANVHDWGKYYSKTYNDLGFGIYYDHGEIGAYELLSHLYLIPQKDFSVMGILRILAYVNYHMKPFDWHNDSDLKKARQLYNGVLFDDLLLFNKIDREACGTESE